MTLLPSRSWFRRSIEHQVDSLGFVPSFIEVAGDDINEDVLSGMARRGIGVIIGVTSPGALARDPRIAGIITGRPADAAGDRDALTS